MNDEKQRPAFPIIREMSTTPPATFFPGLTKREYLAGMAIQGAALADARTEFPRVALHAVLIADAVLEILDTDQNV